MSVHRVSGRPCYYARSVEDGFAFEMGDGVPHHRDAAECIKRTDEWLSDKAYRAVPEGAPCWTFECDECGVDEQDLEGWAMHYPNREDAIKGAIRLEFFPVVTRNRVVCDECHKAEAGAS